VDTQFDEIAHEVDGHPVAKYFLQSRLGLYMRMAVLTEIVGAAGV